MTALYERLHELVLMELETKCELKILSGDPVRWSAIRRDLVAVAREIQETKRFHLLSLAHERKHYPMSDPYPTINWEDGVEVIDLVPACEGNTDVGTTHDARLEDGLLAPRPVL